MTRVHLIYPHGDAISAPDAIGSHLGTRLSERYHVVYHDLQEGGVIQPSADEVLLGHAWPSTAIFERNCRRSGWKRVILMQPYCHGDNQDIFVERFIRCCDMFLAITGSFWFKDIPNSKFKHWLPKMIHLDLAVDRQDFPVLKSNFNLPGKRKFVYIGHNAPYKNTNYLAQIAHELPDIELGWIGVNQGLPGVKPLGRINFATPEGKALITQHDFMLTVGNADGNPTTILEAMAWGLIPVCTPQSGYANYPGIPNVPLGQPDRAAARLRELQNIPEANLRQMQQRNWEALDHHFNWDRFARQVIQAIESTDSPACLPIAPQQRLALLLGGYLDPRASFRQWPRKIRHKLRALKRVA